MVLLHGSFLFTRSHCYNNSVLLRSCRASASRFPVEAQRLFDSSRPQGGRELNYVHAANLADGTAQVFMSKGKVNNHHIHNQEPTRPGTKLRAQTELDSTKEQQQSSKHAGVILAESALTINE